MVLRCSAIFLLSASDCFDTFFFSSLAVLEAAEVNEFRLASSGTSKIPPAIRAGTIGSQDRFGRLRPNRSETSRSATWRTASATSARPAGVSRSSPGRVNAVLSRSLSPNARSNATAASVRSGPVKAAISPATTSASPPPIANGHQVAPGTGTCPSFSTPRTTVASARPAARHQTEVVRNRCIRNRRQTRPIGLSNSFTARPPSSKTRRHPRRLISPL